MNSSFEPFLLAEMIVVSILFSAFFSGMEIAFVTSNKIRLEIDVKGDSLTGRILSIFYRNKEDFISTLLVGNNVSLVIYGIGMAQVLYPLLHFVWDNEMFVVLSQTILSTLLILVTAEFLPKTIFRINPNFLLRIFAAPLVVIFVLLYPVSKFTSLLSRTILYLLGVKIGKAKKDLLMSKIDLDFFIQQSIDDAQDNSEVDTEVKIFQNALDFSNLKVRDCMVPRNELIALNIATTDEKKLISTFTETGLSKILLYRDNIDNILGYIHSSEMFKSQDNWQTSIRPVIQAPETMPGQKLMKTFMKKKKNLAVIIDEFGGTAGIVTLEDLVEEIFGDIEDEHDHRKYIARIVGENEYEFSGRLEIEKINDQFDLSIPESDDYVTIAGYILFHYKTIPKEGEEIIIDNFRFTILKVNVTKIEFIGLKVEN